MRVLAFITALFLSISYAKADPFNIDLTPGISGSFTAMTNYIQRGQTQTNGHPAGNLVLTYDYDGFFGTLSVINSKQGNNNFEGDITIGYRTKLSDNWSYQASIVYQTYPGASGNNNLSNVEFQNIVNYSQPWGTVVGAVAVQPQGQGHGGFYSYVSTGVDFNLPYDFTLGGRIGWNTSANHEVKPNYADWTVTVSRPIIKQVSWAVQYTGSTGHNPQQGFGNVLVGMITVNF